MNKYMSILMLFLLFSLSLSCNNYTNAGVLGDWFNADLDTYPTNTVYFNETIAGDVWLYGDGYYQTGKGKIQADDSFGSVYGGSCECGQVNFTGYFSKISIKWLGKYTGTSTNSRMMINFKDDSNVIILKVWLQLVTGGGGSLHIYDQNGSDKWNYAIGTDYIKQYWINLTKLTNNTYHVNLSTWGNDQQHDIYVYSISYVSKANLSNVNCAGSSYTLYNLMYSIRASTPVIIYPWVLSGYTSKGDSGLITGWGTTSTMLTNTYYSLEQKFSKFGNQGINIKRVCLPLHHTVGSPLNLVNFLFVNGVNQGSYDTYYIWNNDRFVLVWDIDLDIGENDVIFEWFFEGTGKTLSWFTYDNLDYDDHSQYKRSDGNDALKWGKDGEYNGVTTSTPDLLYSFYYSTADTGDSWYRDWLFKGDAGLNYSNATKVNYTTTSYNLLLEQKYNNLDYVKHEISGVGLALGGYTDINNITSVYLKINGEFIGTYDYRYYNSLGSGSYIYFYDDLEYVPDDYGDDLVFEFYFETISNNTNIEILYDSDIDSDGSQAHRYMKSSNSDDYFNGIYDATYSIVGDLVYMFYYSDIFYTGETPDTPYNLLNQVDPLLGWFVGLVVTMVFLFAPIIFMSKLNMRQKIPDYVYGFTGCIGIATSVFFGWFPSWVIFFLIGALIILLILAYVITKNKNG